MHFNTKNIFQVFIQREITLRGHSLEKAIWLYSRNKIRWKLSCPDHLVLLLLSISPLRLNKTVEICTRNWAETLTWLKIHPAKQLPFQYTSVPQVHYNCRTYCASTERPKTIEGSCAHFLLHTVSMSAKNQHMQNSKL